MNTFFSITTKTWILQTKWIKIFKDQPNSLWIDQLRLSLNAEGTLNPKQVSIYVLSNSHPSPIVKPLSELSSSHMNNFKYDQINPPEYYQLAIKVTLDLTKITQNELNLKLTQFSINDPCVNNANDLRTCNGHGQCIRHYETLNSTCSCSPGYKADSDCKMKDYCTFERVKGIPNKAFCKENGKTIECKNDDVHETFDCLCTNKTTRWDLLSSR